MNDYELSKKELECLQEKHKEITDKRAADKLKVVYALGIGKRVEEVCNWYWLSESQCVVIFINIKGRNRRTIKNKLPRKCRLFG